MSSKTISVPPACPLLDVLMSREMATEGTAGVSWEAYSQVNHLFVACRNDFDYISNNYTFIRDITLEKKKTHNKFVNLFILCLLSPTCPING